MLKIQQLTSDSKQKHTINLADGTSIQLTLNYVPQQLGWFIVELIYGNFTLRNFRIFNSPNFLYQYRNKLPFGLSCSSTENREPMFQEDFSSEKSIMYLLTAAEVDQFAEYLSE